MAIMIKNVSVTPQEVTVGQTITVTISAVDVNWNVIKEDFLDWNDIKTKLTNWRSILNYH